MPTLAPLSTHQRHYLRLAQYNTWFNGQLYACADTLSDETRGENRGAFFGSIHATLDHILLCDRLWLGRIQRSVLPFPSLDDAVLAGPIAKLDQGVCADWQSLCAERKATDAVLEAFVRELTPERLDTDLEYQNTRGALFTSPLWHVVAHLFNHGTHHRGQVTTLLMQEGADPGVTDFMVTAMMPLEV